MANSLLNDEQQETGSPETSAEALERIPTAERAPRPTDRESLESIPTAPKPPRFDVDNREPTYDRPGNESEDEQQQPGTRQSDNQRSPWKPWQKNNQGESGSPKDEASNLKDRENSSQKNGSDKKTPGNERSLYRPSSGANSTDPKNKILNKFLGTRKKKLIGLGGSTGIIIGLIFGFSVVQGPLQLIHLSQILGKNDSHNEKTITARMNGLFRFARTNDIAETRLGKAGSLVYNNARSSLSNVGIDFQTDNRGVIKSVSFDATKNPELKNLSFQQRIDFLKKTYIPDGNKTLKVTGKIGNPNNFVIDNISSASFKDIKYSEFILRTSISKLENGKIISGMNLRYLKKAFNLPKLFSPWEKVSKVASAKAYDSASAKIAERNRLKSLKPPETTKIGLARVKVKNVLEQNQGKFTVALIGTTGLCLVRSIANDAVVVNRALIVVPATVQAVDKIAAGSQVQAGQASLADIGAITQSFTDSSGKTIFDGVALQATAGTMNPSGEDLPVELAQAFSGKTKADNIRQAIEVNVPGTNIDITGAVCSDTGVIIQAAAGILVLLTAIPTGGASVGAWIASNTAMAVATAGVVMLLQHELGNLIKGNAVLPDTLSGPLGGNVLAYAAREKANIQARSAGGVELSDQESQQIDTQKTADDQKEFNSKNLLAKLFDVHDYRSVASRLIDKSSPNINQNLAKMGNIFTNFSNIFSSITKLLTPITHAESKPYTWASSRYGIPDSVLSDPALQDPYDNAEQAAKLIDSNSGLKDRAQKCFGVTIDNTNPDQTYSVVANSDVNPGDDDYNGANCNDDSTEWRRIMLFVFDSRISDATSCYQGDSTSCANMGIEGVTTPLSTVPTPTPITFGDVTAPSQDIQCAPGTKDLGLIDGYSGGALTSIRGCAVSNIPCSNEECTPGSKYYVNGSEGKAIVNSRVSGAFYAMAEAFNVAKATNKNLGTLSTYSSFRTMTHQQDIYANNPNTDEVATPGNSSHQMGLALDIDGAGHNVGDGTCSKGDPNIGRQTADTPIWNWLHTNAPNFGIKQYCNESWHWDASNLANRVP